MIRVHVEAVKNTNSVMGRIRVEAMKSHALANRARVETMAVSILEKVPFHAGLQKTVDLFPRTNGAADIKMDVSSHVETVCQLVLIK